MILATFDRSISAEIDALAYDSKTPIGRVYAGHDGETYWIAVRTSTDDNWAMRADGMIDARERFAHYAEWFPNMSPEMRQSLTSYQRRAFDAEDR